MSKAICCTRIWRWSRGPSSKATPGALKIPCLASKRCQRTGLGFRMRPNGRKSGRTKRRRPLSDRCRSRIQSIPKVLRRRHVMFGSKHRGTVIAKGIKIVGSVTAEGLVEVNGQIDGELHCTSLIVSHGAHVTGTIAAGRVVVDGKVDGPLQGGEVILKSKAHVVGDIQHQSLAIERGAYFEGRSMQ